MPEPRHRRTSRRTRQNTGRSFRRFARRSRDRQVEHYLNGERTARYQIGSDEWKRLVAASKWKDFPAFATATRGHLAIQEHGNRVAFRNLKIRPLGGR